jgi:hypothetical protein
LRRELVHRPRAIIVARVFAVEEDTFRHALNVASLIVCVDDGRIGGG